MHGVIRRYRVRLGTVAQAARYTEKGFLPILRGIPGFVSSHLLDEGNDVLTWMALLETEEAAEAAVRASRDWFRDEWSSFRPLPPEVVTGEVLARATADRRRTVDRRRLALVGTTAWDGPGRRAGSDRPLEAPSWARAGALARDGIGSVLTQLGEQVTNRDEAAGVRDQYLRLFDEIRSRDLPAEISVKLTHLGLDVNPKACLQDLLALAARAAAAKSFLWIDMEESRYVDATLELYRAVRVARPDVGVCLQAYLRRTPADLEGLLPLAPAIRVVKGAYNEPPDVAFPKKRDVDAAYAVLAGRLLERAAAGAARVVLGTHDLDLIERLQARRLALRVTGRGHGG